MGIPWHQGDVLKLARPAEGRAHGANQDPITAPPAVITKAIARARRACSSSIAKTFGQIILGRGMSPPTSAPIAEGAFISRDGI